jgi:hypothetical protein
MKHFAIRSGNIVLYIGGLREFYNKPAEVIVIDPINGDDTYSLKVKNWKKEELTIRAYKDEIWPITLDLAHINAIGFIKSEKLNIFSLDGVKLVRPIFLKSLPDGGNMYDDKGFVVVVGNLPLPFNEEQLVDTTVPVTFLHYLQNYYADNLTVVINPDLFL